MLGYLSHPGLGPSAGGGGRSYGGGGNLELPGGKTQGGRRVENIEERGLKDK